MLAGDRVTSDSMINSGLDNRNIGEHPENRFESQSPLPLNNNASPLNPEHHISSPSENKASTPNKCKGKERRR